MRARDLDTVRSLVQTESGMVLNEDQSSAVERRLLRLAQREQLGTITQLVSVVRRNSDLKLRRRVAEALTINETQFFRDPRVFDALAQTVLPRLLEARARLTVWCAASASGQEPYSLAMILRDQFPQVDVKIFATDFSKSMVARTDEGRYSESEVRRGLMPAVRERHLIKDGDSWRVRPDIRAMVQVEQLNLVGPWRPLPTFDLVLIRNVLGYLDPLARLQVLGRVRALLPADGVMVVGATESCVPPESGYARFIVQRSTFYRPAPAPELHESGGAAPAAVRP